ncbi:MAG TPA: colanic acid biosynthesis glycosyltransferase WcaL [Thiothrix sp.]|nr:colanic acid biosynthesis glycosyltransferase WcaL [Thiothrix sp.]
MNRKINNKNNKIPLVGVLLRRYPKLSETFILGEILGLEQNAVPLHIFSLYTPSDAISNPATQAVKASVTTLIHADKMDWQRMMKSHLRLLTQHPLRYLSSLAATALRYETGRIRDFLQAGRLADELIAHSIQHLHAHFIAEPVAVAEIASRMAAIPFSISAHAKDIYLSPTQALQRKLEAAQFTVTCTQYNWRYLQRLSTQPEKIHRMYHGLNLIPFDRTLAQGNKQTSQNAPLIVSVGRLREKKGFPILISACKALHDQGHAFRCVIVGYGAEQARLQQQINQQGLHNQVQLLGKQAHEEVLALYKQASIFALPCRIATDGDRDGIPNVLLEAMAMHLPVVSTAVSGIPELIQDGNNGLLVPADDSQAFSQAFIKLLQNPMLAQQLGDAGRHTVEQHFSTQRNLQQLMHLLPKKQSATNNKTSDNISNNTIAYILKGFPRLSETFIANEIYLLEQLGTKMALFSIKKGEAGQQHAVIDKIQSPLRYLPRMSSLSGSYLLPWLVANSKPYLRHHGKLLLTSPRRYVTTLAHAIALTWKHRRSRWRLRKVFIKEFIQAGFIASHIKQQGSIRLLHAHFCHGATTVAWFTSELTGLPFSFTAHAKDIYQQQLNPGDLLQQKLQAAAFVTTCTHANHHHLSALSSQPENVHTIYHGLDTDKFIPHLSALTPQPENVHTIYHGLDTDKFIPQEKNTSLPLILAVGRHVEKKGFVYLLEACVQLRALNIDFQCQIIGESGDQTARIQQLIHDKKLEAWVTLKPAVTQETLKALYQQSTIFALPCVITADGDRDGIPNVMAEAMATGLPIVSSPISGIPELVKDNRNGLLVPPRDVDALAAALQRLLSNTKLRHRLGKAARETICQRFDSSTTTRSLQRLFDNYFQQEQEAHWERIA